MDHPPRENRPGRKLKTLAPNMERLERRAMMDAAAASVTTQAAAAPLLTTSDVNTLLARASAATASDNAIVAVVDRAGNILGVRVEGNVSTAITGNNEKLVFSIDGAVAEARTGAFFASDAAPLTSRTIQNLSESTMTQREVQSDPNLGDPNSTSQGPGFVAPIGSKAHFPSGVEFTPTVDLFQIEHTNRDSILHTGSDLNRANYVANDTDLSYTGDVLLSTPTAARPLGSERFNINLANVPAGQELTAPESYGFTSGLLTTAQSRGIGTLPGGIPIYKTVNGQTALVGGIGVFFPGTTGYATEENSILNNQGFYNAKLPDLSKEAEYIAFVAAGGSKGAGVSFNTPAINAKLGLPSFTDGAFNLPFGRIDLVGITLDIYGAHGAQGPKNLANYGAQFGRGNTDSGVNMPLTPGAVAIPASTVDATLSTSANVDGPNSQPGVNAPDGWLVTPHDAEDGTGLTAADVTEIINRGIAEAKTVRAAIRLPLNSNAEMIFAVTDLSGNVLGMYRMPDATVFSEDVAVAKARNVAYYANASTLQPQDQISNIPAGVAFTNRSFRYLSQPRFPEGIDGNPPGPFSILNEQTLTNAGGVKPADAYQTVQGYDSFNPTTNFHEPFNVTINGQQEEVGLNQNGIVFFPGSVPLYKTVNGQKVLVGGLGVSGDGVDQDDDVTYVASTGYATFPNIKRSDDFFVRGARIPYQKFNRNPHLPTKAVKNLPPDTKLPGGVTPVLPTKGPLKGR